MHLHRYYCVKHSDWPSILIKDLHEVSRIERSAEEYRLHHLPADLRFSSAVNTTTIEQYVRTFENTAVSISKSHTTGEYKGKPIDKKGNETITLTLVDKQWKISHIHWSH